LKVEEDETNIAGDDDTYIHTHTYIHTLKAGEAVTLLMLLTSRRFLGSNLGRDADYLD
jgi:hypothetical protein